MKLTELQLECQRLGADTTLSFGCLVSIVETFGLSFGYRVGQKTYRPDLERQTTEKDQDINIIGHPIDRGRLAYLYWKDCLNEVLRDKYIYMEVHFNQNPELYNQTILDRDEKTLTYVRNFLLSIQEKGQ